MITPNELYRILKSYGIEHREINNVLREANDNILQGVDDPKKLSAALAKYGDIIKATALYLEANYKSIIKAGLVKKLKKAFPSINFGDYVTDSIIKDYSKYPHLFESNDVYGRLRAITEFINNEVYRIYTYIVTDINETIQKGSPVDPKEIFERYSLYEYAEYEDEAIDCDVCCKDAVPSLDCENACTCDTADKVDCAECCSLDEPSAECDEHCNCAELANCAKCCQDTSDVCDESCHCEDYNADCKDCCRNGGEDCGDCNCELIKTYDALTDVHNEEEENEPVAVDMLATESFANAINKILS